MGTTDAASRLDALRRRLGLTRTVILYGAVLVNTELLLVLAYVAFALDGGVRRPSFFVYPFVWINVGLYALWRAERAPGSARERWLARTVALGYFAVLAYAGGLVGPGGGSGATGVRVVLTGLPPGWAPALLYDGATVRAALLPFKLFGYAVLAYLVYAAVLDAASGLVGGLLGLLSCVSCTLPVVAGVLSGFVGSTAVVAAAGARGYGLSTAVFVLTVGLLLWRPDWGTVRRVREAVT